MTKESCCKTDKETLDPKNIWKVLTLLLFSLSAFLLFFDVDISSRFQGETAQVTVADEQEVVVVSEEEILPGEGVDLLVDWGSLGLQMIEAGVIDKEELELIYAARGGLNDDQISLLYGEDNGSLKIDSNNAGFILNLFWALGLSNQNSVLDEGTMQDYDDQGSFASTGGWSLSIGDSMDHYSEHSFIELSSEQESLVEDVAKGIYRPCCNNSTYFPDCNHGMAMLGFLELLASQGASEEEMYEQALQVNAYWFPSQYLNNAQYF
ncbi:MAG: hypothetical protein Q8P27_02145, partial [Candidatus Peregrinibacteria bacterium]|nr:hypothetical protein [Candidatus Peregrinibacteria bacterium]